MWVVEAHPSAEQEALAGCRDLRTGCRFDADRSVADAGLILPATLSQRLGVEALTEELVGVGHRPGRKLLTVVHALLAGGDRIDDTDVLRSVRPATSSVTR